MISKIKTLMKLPRFLISTLKGRSMRYQHDHSDWLCYLGDVSNLCSSHRPLTPVSWPRGGGARDNNGNVQCYRFKCIEGEIQGTNLHPIYIYIYIYIYVYVWSNNYARISNICTNTHSLDVCREIWAPNPHLHACIFYARIMSPNTMFGSSCLNQR